jgi:hypothetical protein
MSNLRVLLIRLKIHKIIEPFKSWIFKTGNFSRLSLWIYQHRKLDFNDYYNPQAVYEDRYKLYQYIIEHKIIDQPVNYFEFGVEDGTTIKWWAKELKHEYTRFYGFDTFEGLPEDWGIYKKGSFSTQGEIPVMNDTRVEFKKGMFQQTLQPFLSSFDNSRKNIIMLDADLYSSTLFALTSFAAYLKKNDILIFDEFLTPQHEFLAYYNFCQAFPHINLKAIGAANNYCFVAFEVA